MKNIAKKIVTHLPALLLSLFILAVPVLVFAQNNEVKRGLDGISGSFGGSGLARETTALGFLKYVVNLMLMFAGIIAVLFLIVGGYWYITSAGNEEQAEKGKGTVLNAIIGIVIIVLSFVIINVVSNFVTRTP